VAVATSDWTRQRCLVSCSGEGFAVRVNLATKTSSFS
jgi:hypothetical protein